MVKSCVTAGCSNMYKDGVSLFQFPWDEALCKQRTNEVRKTCAKWQGPTNYSVLFSKHFTMDCFEHNTIIAAGFGMKKQVHLEPHAVPKVFHRHVVHSSSRNEMLEGPSTSRKRPIDYV